MDNVLIVVDDLEAAEQRQLLRSDDGRLTFRHPERTLRDREIEGRRSRLLKVLEEGLGVRARV